MYVTLNLYQCRLLGIYLILGTIPTLLYLFGNSNSPSLDQRQLFHLGPLFFCHVSILLGFTNNYNNKMEAEVAENPDKVQSTELQRVEHDRSDLAHNKKNKNSASPAALSFYLMTAQ